MLCNKSSYYFSDLWYPVPLAILVIIVRSWVEKKVFKPLGNFHYISYTITISNICLDPQILKDPENEKKMGIY